MSLEIILWLIGGFIFCETIFIFNLKTNFLGFDDDWILTKVFSFCIGAMITGFHAVAVFESGTDQPSIGYIFFLYEAIIILSGVLLFLLNSEVVKMIRGKK